MSALDYLPTVLGVTDERLERVPKEAVVCLAMVGAVIYGNPRYMRDTAYLLTPPGFDHRQTEVVLASYLANKGTRFYRYFPEGS